MRGIRWQGFVARRYRGRQRWAMTGNWFLNCWRTCPGKRRQWVTYKGDDDPARSSRAKPHAARCAGPAMRALAGVVGTTQHQAAGTGKARRSAAAARPNCKARRTFVLNDSLWTASRLLDYLFRQIASSAMPSFRAAGRIASMKRAASVG